jgi:hypothetical protein
MPIRTAYSSKDLCAAVADLREQAGTACPRAVLCFASTKYDPAALARELKAAFPGAVLAGCSTAGEIVSGRMLTGSMVAMLLDAETVEDAACAVVRDLDRPGAVAGALHRLEEHFGMPLAAMDMEKHVGVVLFDGMSGAEERLMEQIGDRTDLFFVGGSAGDDLKFQATHVIAAGEAYRGAMLLLLKLRKGFEIIKTQSFTATGTVLEATEVDEPGRRVIRFNGRPAAEAYAAALQVPVEKLSGEFMRHPLGLMIDGQPYVRSPQRVDGGSVIFYCRIAQGTELTVLDATDIVGDTRAAVTAKLAELGGAAGVIDFHCILRTLQLRAEHRTDDYGAIFREVPAIGFSTYGEAYLGHINQTSTMLVIR